MISAKMVEYLVDQRTGPSRETLEKRKIKQKLSIKGSQLAEQSIKKKETQNQKEHFAVFLLILSLTSSPAQQWSYRQQTASVRP